MTQNVLLFLLTGLRWTLLLSVIAFASGMVAGLFVALARTSGHRALEQVTAGYIAVFQGTPLLMQLFVVYFAFALIGFRLASWHAVAIGFTQHARAYLC